MGSDQHFCLRWNNFHSNIAASFEHLRDHEEFVDVTLACEGRSLKAHKIVLSACSPYFKNLLKQNPCQHPIIILRDVAFPDLSALLNFVYQGEVYVSQERLPAFLRTAEMLHIKGLTDQNHQSSNSAHPTCPPVSIGPPSSTTIFQATHDQSVLCNKVSILGVPLTSPRSQTPPSPSSHSQHHHISPPPKKRRSATTITALPSGSPTTTSPPTPTSSSTPPRMELFSTSREDGLGPGHLDGSTLAAALMKPLCGSGRSEVIVTPSRPPLHPSSVHLHDTLKVKQEVEEISQNDIKEEGDEEVNQAVNLVTEGSILRQRIQGYRGSPDAPLPLSLNTGNGRLPPLSALSTSISHEDSASEDGFFGGGDTGGEGGGDDSEQEKEALAASPMVIRSPLGGILQRDAPGLFGGAGTSGSLSHHDSSQDADFLVRACVPKLWNSRQPGICPICNRVFSNKFNLKQHIINIHTKGEGVECDMCHKKCKNKWYLRRHQVTHHGAPLKRNRSFPIEQYVNDENDHGMKDLPSG